MGPLCLLSLPAEILEMVLDYLEDYPPSYFGSCIEPNLNLISARHRHPPLKSLSRVSKFVRVLVLPRLFRCTIHLVTLEARKIELEHEYPSFSNWPRKFWEFVTFLEEMELGHVVRTFTLAVKEHPELDVEDILDPQSAEAVEYQKRWICLFATATPWLSRVTIVAPPEALGTIIGTSIYSPGNGEGLPYQVLSLWVVPFFGLRNVPQAKEISHKRQFLLTARPWTHLLLNEGLLLNAVSRWRGDQLYEVLSTKLCALQQKHNVFPELRSVSYTGIFATVFHLDKLKLLLGALPKLEEVQFSLRSTAAQSNPVLLNRSLLMTSNLMSIKDETERLAKELGVERCLEHLKDVCCLDFLEPVELSKTLERNMLGAL